ncbi:hypothetical protein RKD23_000053 [Streptomyces sp. SAI-170]
MRWIVHPASDNHCSETAGGQRPSRKVDEVAPLIDGMLWSETLIKGAVVHERLVVEYGFTGTYPRVT